MKLACAWCKTDDLHMQAVLYLPLYPLDFILKPSRYGFDVTRIASLKVELNFS